MTEAKILTGLAVGSVLAPGEAIRVPDPELSTALKRHPDAADAPVLYNGELTTAADALTDVEQTLTLADALIAVAAGDTGE